MIEQLDLFKAQGVPSYGDAFTKRRTMDDPEVRDMMATLNATRDKMMQSPEFKALQAQWAREAEAAAEPLDLDDDENEHGEVIEARADEQVPAARTLHDIARDYWGLLFEFDAAMRATGNPPEHLEAGMKALEREANGGDTAIYGGRDRFPGPYRLRALVKWHARREGRLPMWGVKHQFRFTCRGMHVVAELGHYGLGMSLDQDRHRPGDPCWSDTGYRSFGSSLCGPRMAASPVEAARALLEAYIDQPRKGHEGGLGGQLKRWIPWAAKPWAERERERAKKPDDFNRPYDPAYRAKCPTMTPAEDRAAYWAEWEAETDSKAEEALAWMKARGVDPYELFPDCKPPAQAALL